MEMPDRNETGFTVTREFDAPRELVWKAFTEPERVKRWWGPKSFTAPVARSDFRVGGHYLYAMRAPDGQDFWSTGVFREIVPLERLVATDSFADEHGNVVPATHYGMSADIPLELEMIVTFEDVSDQKGGSKTRLTLIYPKFASGEQREYAIAGWNESLDKLEDYMASVLDEEAERMMIMEEIGERV